MSFWIRNGRSEISDGLAFREPGRAEKKGLVEKFLLELRNLWLTSCHRARRFCKISHLLGIASLEWRGGTGWTESYGLGDTGLP